MDEIKNGDFRAKINNIDKVKKLAEELRSTPTGVVNFLVDSGVEVLSRGSEEIKKEIKKRLLNYFK